MWLSKDKRSGYYRAFWTDASGKQRSLTTKQTTEPEARAWAKANHVEEMETAARMGALTPQLVSRFLTGDALTVPRAINRFLAWGEDTGNLSASSLATLEVTLRAWCRECDLNSTLVSTITAAQISQYINRPTTRKESTCRNELSILRRFFEYLRGEGLITNNPGANARLCVDRLLHLQRESERREPFTEAEIEILVSRTSGFWRLACALAAGTGLRLGDIATLEWECISTDGECAVWTDKSDARISAVLSPELLKLLRELPTPHTGPMFPEECAIARDPKRRALLSVQFGRLCHKLGIEGKSFHGLRHAFVTKLAKDGVPVQRIAEAVGHANVETTAIYDHNV